MIVLKPTLLVVDDEPAILTALQALLHDDFRVVCASSVTEAEAFFAHERIDLILSDQSMPYRTGLQLLEWVHQNYPRTLRLLMTGLSDSSVVINAINRSHIYHYLSKPWQADQLLQVMRHASRHVTLERHRDELLQQLQRLNQELELRVNQRTRELEEANRQLKVRGWELERANEELKKYTSELKVQVATDPLTGLLNRRAIEEMVKFELKRHARYPGSVSVGMFDADHFKQINTEYLQTGGDEVLKSLAKILAATVREVDSVARIGGEEFLVLARETNFDGALVLGERIRRAVERTPVAYHQQLIKVTVSGGFAVAEPGAGADYQHLLELAAEAMSQAKRGGRNRCEVLRLQPKPVASHL